MRPSGSVEADLTALMAGVEAVVIAKSSEKTATLGPRPHTNRIGRDAACVSPDAPSTSGVISWTMTTNTVSNTSVATGFVVLCPGQGAQTTGMGRKWMDTSANALAVFACADAIIGRRLGPRLSSICIDGSAEKINRTDISQPALFTCAVACWRALQEDDTFASTPLVAAMGLSLGEYSALHIAGAIDFESALELVLLRGKAMQEAAEKEPGGMVALVGADEDRANEVCDRARGNDVLVCANFNAPGQIVLSGHTAACARAVDVATEMKLRATPLAVAGAFHSPLMQPAADRLETMLAMTTFHPPSCTVLANVDIEAHPGSVHGPISGRPTTNAAQLTRDLLARQLTGPVRWSDSCERLASAVAHAAQTGTNRKYAAIAWHEMAPGKTLSGLMRRTNRDVTIITHEAPQHAN